MSSTLPGADVRAFYAALGVELRGWAHTEAPVRCFADPDAHAHQDRDASCSVNMRSGAFNCHACGAHGGAYDAALAVGRPPREAIDLMVTHGLTQRRPRRDRSRTTSPASTRDTSHRAAARGLATRRGAPASATEDQRRTPLPAARQCEDAASSLSVGAEDVRRWARALRDNGELLARLRRERGWGAQTLRELGVGFDGERITVPIADERGALQGVLCLRVDGAQQPKVLAAPGTRLGLIPHPAHLTEGLMLLVEGPSDMFAARSAGLPAIAVPGTHAWRAEWAGAFTGREVTVVMDCDRPGREAAARIGEDLDRAGARVRIVELAPERADGYDLSDWLHAGNDPRMVTARWYTREAYTGIARPGGDAWTVQRRSAGPASASELRLSGPVSPRAARSGSVGRGMGCAAF